MDTQTSVATKSGLLTGVAIGALAVGMMVVGASWAVVGGIGKPKSPTPTPTVSNNIKPTQNVVNTKSYKICIDNKLFGKELNVRSSNVIAGLPTPPVPGATFRLGDFDSGGLGCPEPPCQLREERVDRNIGRLICECLDVRSDDVEDWIPFWEAEIPMEDNSI